MDRERLIRRLENIEHERHVWRTAGRIISFDRDTAAPAGGARESTEAAAMAMLMEQRLMCDPGTGDTLRAVLDTVTDDPVLRRRAELLLREHQQLTQLPEALRRQRADLTGRAYTAWLRAREANDFAVLAPLLQQVFQV